VTTKSPLSQERRFFSTLVSRIVYLKEEGPTPVRLDNEMVRLMGCIVIVFRRISHDPHSVNSNGNFALVEQNFIRNIEPFVQAADHVQ